MHGLVYSGPASCPNHITAALSLSLNPSIQSHPNQIQRNMKVKLWFPFALLVLALEFNRLCWTGSLEKSTQKSVWALLWLSAWLALGDEFLAKLCCSSWNPLIGHMSSHLVTASQNSGLNFVAIFNILTPQCPVPSVWPLLGTGQRALNRWQFLGICDKLFDNFYWDGNITVAAAAPLSGPTVLVMTRGWLFCVLTAPAPVATGWRLLENCSQGTEWVGHCHGPRLHREGCAVSWGVSKLITRNTSSTPGPSHHQDIKYTLYTTIQVILNMFSTVWHWL